MSYNPKTPTRRSRSQAAPKTPLTPSSLTSGLHALSIASPAKPRRGGPAPTKASLGDITNPFLQPSRSSKPFKSSKSRPASPLKRATCSGIPMTEELQRQANAGVIRKGGIESRLNVITHDYIPPRPDAKRSKSQPAVVHRERLFPREPTTFSLDHRDRFITNREQQDVEATLEQMHLNAKSASPGHTARLAEAASLPLNKRILAYHEAPPTSGSDPLLAQQREIVRPLYARPGALTASSGAATNKARKLPTQPERVLDAPGMVDDFYLNLISWSCTNVLAVALGDSTYIWRAETGAVTHVGDAPEGTYVASVDFSNDGMFLGVGMGTGEVELWDVETGAKLRTMAGHQNQIATLSWHQHLLSSGCGDGSIWHHDVRVARHKVLELLGHTGEVCGLKWRADGEFIASGGNDNVVNVWDGRLGDVNETSRASARWTKRNHTAAVKAVAWCPWQPALLASGGGTNDATIHVWNTTTGARLHSLRTPAQVTSLQFAPHRKELLSTHGFPTNALMVHAYPALERCVAEIRDAHDARVLFSCVGPAGDVVCTGAGDENLKFWRIWDVPPRAGKTKVAGVGSGALGVGALALR